MQAHLPFSKERFDLFNDAGFKMVLLIRDPRDQAVSLFHYVTYEKGSERFLELPNDSSRLMAAIVGLSMPSDFPDIGKRYARYLPWADQKACLVRFEHLVGEKGGGNIYLQIGEIQKLSSNIGSDIEHDAVLKICEKVFHQKSKTFRKGQIGSWRETFEPEHKDAMKEVAGQLLISLGYEEDLDW